MTDIPIKNSRSPTLPLVSILIPAHNAEQWVAETIQSALGQTWPNKEIIVVDDGSTDQTFTVARQFASGILSVVTQPNQGAAAARNKAYSLCHGDFIQWLDADDLLAPDKVANQMEAVRRFPSDRTLFSAAWGKFYYRPEKARFSPSPLWCDLTPAEWLLRKMGENCFMQTSTWLVSRALSEASGPWDTRLLGDDDGEYFCRVKKASDAIRFVPEAKVYYRQVGSNRLSSIHGSNRKLEAELLSVQLHVGYLLSLEDSPRARTACLKFIQCSLPSFHPERPDLVEKMNQLAASVGGQLAPPRLRWKYSWISRIFGLSMAKRFQVVLPRFKDSLRRSWDGLCFRLARAARGGRPRPWHS